MRSNIMNRKDCIPEHTICRIERILTGIGLKLNVVQEIQHHDLWYSCYVELESFPCIGANGKGVTSAYARASAYAEIMERLQSGILLGGFYPNKRNVDYNTFKSINDGISAYRTHLSHWASDWTDATLKQLFCECPKATKIDNYYDLFEDKMISLPGGMIDFLSGSNGVAAGNTAKEAIVQGICEILERYVLSEIYSNTRDLSQSFSYISSTSLQGLSSYDMINEIEKQGYHCKVIDCTLGDTFPVLGVLVTNASNTRYIFSIASDVDVDICIQRCITEMFQGRPFDARFRLCLQTSLQYNYNPNYGNNLDHFEYLKNYRDHSGKLPLGMFVLDERAKNWEYPFCVNCRTNQEAFHHIIGILKKNNMKTYIRDDSFLGFPTFRIYIPKFSDILFDNGNDVINTIRAQTRIRTGLKKYSLPELQEAVELLYKNNVTSIHEPNEFIGIIFPSEEIRQAGLDSYEVLLMKLCIAQRKWKEAYSYAERASGNAYDDMRTRVRKMAIIAISNNIAKDRFVRDLSQYSSERVVSEIYDDTINNNEIFHCDDCYACKYHDVCMYKQYDEVMMKLQMKKKLYLEMNLGFSIE